MIVREFGNWRGLREAIGKAQNQLRPPPDLKPSEWSEKNVKIPIGNAVPGYIRFDNAPYQREPLDMTANPECNRITLQWGAQVGKTMLALCAQAYRIGQNPVSQIMMQPSQGDLHTWLETKFNPLVEANDTLEDLIAKPRGREGVNNQRMKSYPGGFLMFSWSGSPKTMRGRSAPFIVCDETDGYDRTQEGHPVGLLWQRAATFGDQRLLLEISTPTIKGESWIEGAYEQGDQRQFYVPCPHCDHRQTLKWSGVKWSKADDGQHLPESAAYMCEDCGTLWNDGERIAAIRRGEWRAKKPFRGHASYHLNELYSCFRKLRDVVQSFLDKKSANDLQTFVNVSLAETWEEEAEKVDFEQLMQRAEDYRAPVPAGAVFLTAGVDMQQDRLEVEIVGWGLGDQSWNVDYRVLWGDPLQGDVWDDLDELLAETFMHESGDQLPIGAACLDTGGSAGLTQAAYEYARGKTGRRLFAIKGKGGWGRPVVSAPTKTKVQKRPVQLFTVGTDEAKLVIMRRLGVAKPGPGYCHFPKSRDPEYFEQMTAEKLQTRFLKGFPVREWHKTRDRNEALDCRVYAYAALKIANPNLPRLAKRLEEEPAQAAPEADEKKETPPAKQLKRKRQRVRENSPEDKTEAKPQTKRRKRRRAKSSGGFVNNW